jgi:hypothetical protein
VLPNPHWLATLAWFCGRASRNQELDRSVQGPVSRNRSMRGTGGMCKGLFEKAGVFARQKCARACLRKQYVREAEVCKGRFEKAGVFARQECARACLRKQVCSGGRSVEGPV